METAKIKNIVILILLALNVFLLLAVAQDFRESADTAQAAFQSALEAVEASGIQVSEQVTRVETPAVYSLHRELEQEKKKVAALLGSCTAEDLGGNIWFYNASAAQASLRGSGEIDVLFTDGQYARGGAPEKTAEKLMKKLGLACDRNAMRLEDVSDGLLLEASCLWQGCPVYNASLRFTFSENALLMVSGTRLFDSATAVGATEVMDDLEALLRFVEVTQEEGFICRTLQGMDVGYRMSVSLSGESTLTPVWHFSTDGGDLYINAVSGKTETP